MSNDDRVEPETIIESIERVYAEIDIPKHRVKDEMHIKNIALLAIVSSFATSITDDKCKEVLEDVIKHLDERKITYN